MPELPDITIYLEALNRFIVGRTLQNVVIWSPFVLRTFDPEIGACHGQKIGSVSRIGIGDWTDRLRHQAGDGFPEKVTAFHRLMAVHGKFGDVCPVCAARVQRVVSADREFNDCPGCQTGGRILRDRSLSRLLKDAWPDTVDDL